MAKEPREESEAYIFYWLVPILIIFWLSVNYLPEFFSNRTAKKVKCRADITVTEAKTDFVAKNAYKICMKK